MPGLHLQCHIINITRHVIGTLLVRGMFLGFTWHVYTTLSKLIDRAMQCDHIHVSWHLTLQLGPCLFKRLASGSADADRGCLSPCPAGSPLYPPSALELQSRSTSALEGSCSMRLPNIVTKCQEFEKSSQGFLCCRALAMMLPCKVHLCYEA